MRALLLLAVSGASWRAAAANCPWGFSGAPACQDCAGGFAGVQCDSCAAGHVVYPRCAECSNANHCTGNAAAVSDDGNRDACVCQCKDGFTGDRCDSCQEGHAGYPTCTQCTSAGHCQGNAASVTDDGSRVRCVCTCKEGFAGPTCSECAAGYIGYPQCMQCTALQHCNGNAASVTDDGTRSACVCDCNAGFSDAASGCDQCAPGYQNYPACALVQCTNTQTCNGNAKSAAVVAGACACDCKDGFDGAACDRCIAGSRGYPTCTPCSKVGDCSGNAASVTTNALGTMCECTCLVGFAGAACDRCDEGYIMYPSCKRCASQAHCNGNAVAATADVSRTACLCACSPGFDGSTCNRCAAGYINYPTCTMCSLIVDCNANADAVGTDQAQSACACDCKDGFGGLHCDRCLPGYVAYPQCHECTNHFHCSANARAVTSDTGNDKCVCDCKTGYEGEMCNKCASGYDGYPNCAAVACTVAVPCNGNAVSATLVQGNVCQCSCTPAYDGAACDRCAEGFIDYPTCTQCSIVQHCNSNAAAVSDDGTRDTCACDCAPGFEGAACSSCAVGHVNYPGCRQCSLSFHCNGKADSVTDDGARAGCVCACQDRFEGATCGHCRAGYVNYPDCKACSSETHCNGNAVSATEDSTRTDCTCTCKAGYQGIRCDACAPGYLGYPDCTPCTVDGYCQGNALTAQLDPSTPDGCACECKVNYQGASCGACASTYFGYPECGDCTIEQYCNGNADAISSNAAGAARPSTCDCTCAATFTGDECDACIDGYIGYPMCTRCTNGQHCAGNAVNVGTNANRTSCVCECSDAFAGDACDQCAAGYIGYPMCLECTSAQHCSGFAANVTDDGSNDACVCTCRAGYAGADCGECAPGFIGFPDCKACTVAEHCTGHAVNATDDGTRSECVCTCVDGYGGADCSACAAGVEGDGCDRCKVGFAGYPLCPKCDVAEHCSSHADAVISNPAGDTCECRCSQGYVGDACDACAEGYVGETNSTTCMQCSLATHCSGNAVNVTDDGTRQLCDCACRTGFAGLACDSCGAGHVNYPVCEACSSDVHCNGNAAAANDNGTRDGCVCHCKDGFTGAECNACANGYVGYPACVVCTIDACNGKGLSVDYNATADVCACTCMVGYGGDRCDACASGYGGYPNCTALPPTPAPATATPPTSAPALVLADGKFDLCRKRDGLACEASGCTVPDAISDDIKAGVASSIGAPAANATSGVGVASGAGACAIDPAACGDGTCALAVTVPGEHKAAMEECVAGLKAGSYSCGLKDVGFMDEASPRGVGEAPAGGEDDGVPVLAWLIPVLVAVLLALAALVFFYNKKQQRMQADKERRFAEAAAYDGGQPEEAALAAHQESPMPDASYPSHIDASPIGDFHPEASQVSCAPPPPPDDPNGFQPYASMAPPPPFEGGAQGPPVALAPPGMMAVPVPANMVFSSPAPYPVKAQAVSAARSAPLIEINSCDLSPFVADPRSARRSRPKSTMYSSPQHPSSSMHSI